MKFIKFSYSQPSIVTKTIGIANRVVNHVTCTFRVATSFNSILFDHMLDGNTQFFLTSYLSSHDKQYPHCNGSGNTNHADQVLRIKHKKKPKRVLDTQYDTIRWTTVFD